MVYDLTRLPSITIGRRGENDVLYIRFDVSNWLAEMPDAVISLMVQRNGDMLPYDASNIRLENGYLVWGVTSTDTSIPGEGQIQIRAYRDGKVAKSVIGKLFVSDSLGGCEIEPPDPFVSWFDNILDAADRAKQSAQDAAASETNAAESAATAAEAAATATHHAELAANSAEIAQTAASAAENAKEDADASRRSAQESASSAQNSAHSALISETNAKQYADKAENASIISVEAQSVTIAKAAEASSSAAQAATSATQAMQSQTEAGNAMQQAQNAASEAADSASKAAQSAANAGWFRVIGSDDGILYYVRSANSPSDFRLRDNGSGILEAVYG